MISLAQLIRQYQQAFTARYASKMEPHHYQAMHAIMECHTPAQGALHYQCDACEHRPLVDIEAVPLASITSTISGLRNNAKNSCRPIIT